MRVRCRRHPLQTPLSAARHQDKKTSRQVDNKTSRHQDKKTMMNTTSKQQCAAAPLPVRGGVRGGVCIFSRTRHLLVKQRIKTNLTNDTNLNKFHEFHESHEFKRMTQMKTSFTNFTNLLRKGHRRLRRQFVSSIIIRIIREIRLNSLLKRKNIIRWWYRLSTNTGGLFLRHVVQDGRLRPGCCPCSFSS